MQMTKAYDKDAILNALKKEGIEGGVETLKKCVSITSEWLQVSADMSTEGLVGKLDDFAKPGVKYFEKLAIEKLSELEASVSEEKIAA